MRGAAEGFRVCAACGYVQGAVKKDTRSEKAVRGPPRRSLALFRQHQHMTLLCVGPFGLEFEFLTNSLPLVQFGFELCVCICIFTHM
jgi:hypothetical protein